MHGNRYKLNVQDDDNDDDDDDDDNDDDEDEDDEDETNLSRQTGCGLWALALVFLKKMIQGLFKSLVIQGGEGEGMQNI